MRQLTLNNPLGIGCIRFSAPKEPSWLLGGESFMVRDVRTDIGREMHWTELYRLRDWCNAAIKERENQ